MTFQSAFKLLQIWKTCDLQRHVVLEHWAMYMYSKAALFNLLFKGLAGNIYKDEC